MNGKKKKESSDEEGVELEDRIIVEGLDPDKVNQKREKDRD